MWHAFSNLNEWVRFSDTKAAAVLAADGAILVSVATWMAGSHVDVLKTPSAIAWLCVLVTAAFYSAAYSLSSLVPNLFAVKRKRRTSEAGSSLIFFADIARSFPTSKEFLLTMRQALADPDRAIAEISQQLWANSKVAAAKYSCVTKAIQGLAFAVYVGFIGIIVLAVIRLARSI